MLSITQLQPGVAIKFNNKLYIVTESKHLKLGRGGGIQQVKLRCLIDGTIVQNNFKGNEKIEEAPLTRLACQYLYSDSSGSHFMDQTNFEQYTLPPQSTPPNIKLIPEGTTTDLIICEQVPVSVQTPIKIKVKVKEAAPGIKGSRLTSGTKTVTLETGAPIQAPLFIKTGDEIIIDTRTGSYVERAR